MIEREFIELLKQMPLHDGARGLNDDAAIIPIGDKNLILTKDMMVQGVHYFADADPQDVAWKLVAVNLSDLAAKGALPIGVMLGFTLGEDDWHKSFLVGFEAALKHYDIKLLGGDTVSSQQRIITLTAIGISDHDVPSRSGAKDGDILYVSGPIGDAYAGYEMIKSGIYGRTDPLILAFNRPKPQLELGQNIARSVNAMMDISDGLLIDVRRMAKASNLAVNVILDSLPISENYRQKYGNDRNSILKAATWGDDYQLLCAAPVGVKLPKNLIAIGKFTQGNGLTLSYHGDNVMLPSALGYEHII